MDKQQSDPFDQSNLIRLAKQIDQLCQAISETASPVAAQCKEQLVWTQLVAELQLSELEAAELARALEALAFIHRVSDSLNDQTAR